MMLAHRAVILHRCCCFRIPHLTTAISSSSCRLLSSSSNSNNSNEDWIPPSKPLAGDTVGAHAYTHVEEATELKQLERELLELEESNNNEGAQIIIQQQQEPPPPDPQPDWLQTRRSVLSKTSTVIDATVVADPLTKLDLDESIPVKTHTLLSAKELSLIIQVLGGENVKLVMDAQGRRGGRPHGIIVVTAEHFTLRRSIADGVIYQMRRRMLHEVGVVGAEQGVDGNVDDPHEAWIVVDCHHIVVHIFNRATRKAVDLEALWSGDDDMYRIDLTDENALDEYVANHPVPDDFYNASLSMVGGGPTNASWDDTLKQLQTSQWVAQSRPKQLGRRPAPMSKRKKPGMTSSRINRR